MQQRSLYALIWRWHFYAGLLVLPLVLVLASSGAIYLFKPQIERWEERGFQGLPEAGTVGASAQAAAALAGYPGARLASYRLPEKPGDAAMIHLALPTGAMRDVFVAPQGQVLGSFDPESRLIPMVRRVHGQLLLGRRGSWLVELAASWAIVMICTGLYLWWPRAGDGRRGLAGVVWPRLGERGRLFWRDLHAVTGFWVSGLALVLLFTGLPWADVWGSAFKAVRTEMGWVKGTQDWTIGGRKAEASEPSHREHDHAVMMETMGHGRHHSVQPLSRDAVFDQVVASASRERLAFPVVVVPPGTASARPGGKPSPDWTVRSETANRPLAVTLRFDGQSGQQVSRETFADKHPIDRVVSYGVAWHEGQLFGWINQLIGLLTALMLVTIVVSGFVMWRRRKPEGLLGAPPLPPRLARSRGLLAGGAVLALLLPLFALSLVVLWLFDRLLLPRLPGAARWLGVT